MSKNAAFYNEAPSSVKTNEVSGIILWKSIASWADEIYVWAQNTGRKNTLCTLHELVNGNITIGLGEYSKKNFLNKT